MTTNFTDLHYDYEINVTLDMYMKVQNGKAVNIQCRLSSV